MITVKALLNLILFVILPGTMLAQAGLEGKIIDKESNSIVTLASVELRNAGDQKKETVLSDISGNYFFREIKPGNYFLKVTHIGYSVFESSIKITDERKVFDVYLLTAEVETERINVTSTKSEVTLQQTPSSISVVTSDEIRKKNILTFDNVLEGIQGVTVNRSSGINVNSLSIRGSSDVAGGGIGNRVLLLLDGRPSLTGDSKGALWSLIPVSIIDRTEVVKGAFSSLYGSSAIGGVVNVITKKPTYKPYTGVNLNYGFYQKLDDSLKYTDKLLSFSGADILHSNTLKKFSYLLNFNYKKNDGHAEQTDYDFYSAVGKFTYDVLSNRDLEVTLQYSKSNSGYPHYWKKEAGEVAEPYKVDDHYIGDKIKKETQSYDLYYRAIPNSTSKYTTRFYYYYLNSNSYYNPLNPVSALFAEPGAGLNTYIDSYNLGNITQVDLQLGRDNYLISGLDFQMNIVKSDPKEILYGDQQMNNIGIFVQDQMKLLKDSRNRTILEATVGARADHNKVVNGLKSFKISPKFSMVYSPSVKSGNVFSSSSFRFLTGTAFRAPSIAEMYFKKELFGGFDFIFNPELKPEEMLSAETGFRKQFRNRFTLDVSFFFNKYDNLIQYVNVGNSLYGPFQVQNIANSQIKGFEFYIDYKSHVNVFSDQMNYFFNISYTYLDARDLSKNRKDDFLPYKPKHNFIFTLNFDRGPLNLNIDGRYLSKIDEVIFYKLEEPESYFLLNAKLNCRLSGKLSFFAAVSNLLDESYQELERIQAPNRNFNSGFSFEF